VVLGLQVKILLDYQIEEFSNPLNPLDEDCLFLIVGRYPITHTSAGRCFKEYRNMPMYRKSILNLSIVLG